MLSNVFCRFMKPLIAVNCTKSRKNITTVEIWSQPLHRKLKILSPRTDHDTCKLTTFRVYLSRKTQRKMTKTVQKREFSFTKFWASKTASSQRITHIYPAEWKRSFFHRKNCSKIIMDLLEIYTFSVQKKIKLNERRQIVVVKTKNNMVIMFIFESRII